MSDWVPGNLKQGWRAIRRKATAAAYDARKTVRCGSRAARAAGEIIEGNAKSTARSVAQHAKDIAGDVVDAGARGSKFVEEKLRRQHGDRILTPFPRPIQLDDYSCGVQCTMAILEYFGHERRERELRRELRTTKRSGTDRAEIMSVLRTHGCRCTSFDSGRRETLERAIAAKAPVLVEVDGDHWAVVYGIGRENVYLADPSLSRSRRVVLEWEEFRDRWDRAGLVARGPRRHSRAAR